MKQAQAAKELVINSLTDELAVLKAANAKLASSEQDVQSRLVWCVQVTGQAMSSTVYVMDLKKQIEELKKRIEGLNAEISAMCKARGT